MHQEHVGNDSSGESSPWVGICVIDGHLPRVFMDSPPLSFSLSLPLSVSHSRNVDSGVQSVRAARFCTAQEWIIDPRLD